MKTIIIDVREKYEYLAGHVNGAINIPLGDIMRSQLLESISKTDQLIVYCRSGNRSDFAKNILNQIGYKNVENGINQAYVEANYFNS